jgi:hypothetical protein
MTCAPTHPTQVKLLPTGTVTLNARNQGRLSSSAHVDGEQPLLGASGAVTVISIPKRLSRPGFGGPLGITGRTAAQMPGSR